MQGLEGVIISAMLGAGLGLAAAFFIRRWRNAAQARKLASTPKVYASRQEKRKEERALMKAQRSARKKAT